ncbi:MAG: hypothetical protein ICV69_10740 [Thermoleophilaceae bacterium]|nr:hypothetical protein [Thermoleophilaceae bacterium]
MTASTRSTAQQADMDAARRDAVVRFTDVAEFPGELARDAELVERRIVRLTQEARAAQGGAFHYLLVHAGAVIEGQFVCLTACAGQHWGEGMPETKAAYAKAGELAGRIRTACEAAGLETRPGAFEEQLR